MSDREIANVTQTDENENVCENDFLQEKYEKYF